MAARFSDLKNKELICSKDGNKIGFVDDVEFDPQNYQITHLIAYGRPRLFGLLGRYDDVRIGCEMIQVIGDDIILVEDYQADGYVPIRKQSILQKLFE